MKRLFAFIILFSTLSISCDQALRKQLTNLPDGDIQSTPPTTKIEASKEGEPLVPAADLLTDFMTFWNYYSRDVKLNQDFLAYDTKAQKITKETFLKQLNTGFYFPLRVHTKNSDLGYKLEKIPAKADPIISAYMKQFSKQELIFYRMQGKEIPAFHFTGIDGQSYTSENTKGKIILFKCWFIKCVACVQEMPALNELAKKYQGRKDVLFISLAMDGKKELVEFLRKTRFDYATGPMQKKYMAEKLNVVAYPTHFLIDKSGKLVRALYNDVEVGEALEKEISL